MKAGYAQVLLVDGGNFFPENDDPNYGDVAGFLMDAMKLLGTDAVGTSEHELRYGYSFLKANIERSGLPMVCANLYMKSSGKLALSPYVIKKVGSVRVGIFSLMSDKVAYGPSADSLKVEEPTATARRMVVELKKKGATVTVLLSELGKIESEDLAAAVPGIDVVIIGPWRATAASRGSTWVGRSSRSTRRAPRPPGSATPSCWDPKWASAPRWSSW